MERLASIRRTRLDKTLDLLGVPPFDDRGELLPTEARLDLWSADPRERWFEAPLAEAPTVRAPGRPADRYGCAARRTRRDGTALFVLPVE